MGWCLGFIMCFFLFVGLVGFGLFFVFGFCGVWFGFFWGFFFVMKEYIEALENDQEAVDVVVCQRLSFRTGSVYNLIVSFSVYVKDLQYVFSFCTEGKTLDRHRSPDVFNDTH